METQSNSKIATLPSPMLVKKHQVAALLGVGVRTIENMMHARRIPYIKVGGNVRFSIPKVLAALDNYEIEAIEGPRK
jgi:excisionase family DNA binding protein